MFLPQRVLHGDGTHASAPSVKSGTAHPKWAVHFRINHLTPHTEPYNLRQLPPPPLCNPPRETVASMFCQLTCTVLVCVAHLLYAWPCFAFPLLQIKHLCVFCGILSPKALSFPHSFGSSITFVLDGTHWHRINAKVASHVFSLLASVEGTTVCLEIPLQSPPPPGRPSLGDRLPPPTRETVAR